MSKKGLLLFIAGWLSRSLTACLASKFPSKTFNNNMHLEVNKMKNIENCSKTKGIMHLVFGIPDTFKSEGYE